MGKLTAAVACVLLGCSTSSGPTVVDPLDSGLPTSSATQDAATAVIDAALDSGHALADSSLADLDAAIGPDGAIPCEQFSADDDDSDGILNGCDVCPMGPDDDDDENGYPDACDAVMWSRRLRASTGADIRDALVRLQVVEPDGEPERVFAEQSFTLTADTAADIDITSEAIAGLAEDALTPLGPKDTLRRIRVSLAWNLGVGIDSHTEALALVNENVITRLRIRGRITEDGADVTFELRGYRGFQ